MVSISISRWDFISFENPSYSKKGHIYSCDMDLFTYLGEKKDIRHNFIHFYLVSVLKHLNNVKDAPASALVPPAKGEGSGLSFA